MSKKTETFLAEARTWLEKNKGPELETKAAELSLETAERAARDVDSLKENLAAALEERRVAFLVLEETLKSAKHARKARDARETAEKKAEKPVAETGAALAEGPKKGKKEKDSKRRTKS